MKKILIICIILLNCISVYSPGRELDVKVLRKVDFKTSYAYILSLEGWYAHVEHDKGMETYAGISRLYYPKWHGWQYLDRYKWQHGGKIAWNMHIPDKMLDFYVQDFYLDIWVKEKWYDLNDQKVANHTIDLRINGTPGVRIIKRTLNDLGWKLNINNNMDSTTIHYINNSNKYVYLRTLKHRREAFYHNIVKRDSTQKKFLSNWLSRSNKI
jgi:hypothetical protein